MQKILDYFYTRFANLIGGLILAITILIMIDVGGRFIADKPLLGGVEISTILLSFVVFGAYSYALFQGAHVRVSVLTRYFPDRWQELVSAFVCLLGMVFLAFVTYSAWVQFWSSWLIRETMRAPIELPRWLIKFALTCGCFLFTVQFGFDLVNHLRRYFRLSGD